MLAALFLPFLFGGLASDSLSPGVVKDPPIELWISNDRRFFPGEDAQVHVRADEDGFLVVLHADPDGRLRVLFPLDPRDNNFVRGGKRYEIRGRGDRRAFEAGITGRGTVYAAISKEPFRFGRYTADEHWDYGALAPERLPREPEAEFTELVRDMAAAGFDYDVLSYDVIERVYASGYSYRPAYRHWATDVLCDPFYHYDYYCRPYYGTYLSIGLTFGRPYRHYYYGYRPYHYYYYDPFFYRPAYVYPRGYYSYGTGRYSSPGRFYGPRRPRGYGFDDYRDRRFTDGGAGGRRFTFGDAGDRSRTPLVPARGSTGGVRSRDLTGRRTLDRPEPSSVPRVEARPARPDAGRRPDVVAGSEPRREPRSVARPASPAPGERRSVEARRARPRPNIDAASPERGSLGRGRGDGRDADVQPRRVERRSGESRGSAEPRPGPEARPSRRDDGPRDVEPRQAEPRRRDDGGGREERGGGRGAEHERRGGGGGGDRSWGGSSRSGSEGRGHDGGGGGGRRR